MKVKKIQIKQNDKLFVWSMYLLFGCLVLFAIVLGVRLNNSRKDIPAPVLTAPAPVEKIWMDYTNIEFKFSMDVPRLLTKRETRDQAGYRYFMILAENQVAKGKGVSLGVTSRSMDEEIAETKKGYEEKCCHNRSRPGRVFIGYIFNTPGVPGKSFRTTGGYA